MGDLRFKLRFFAHTFQSLVSHTNEQESLSSHGRWKVKGLIAMLKNDGGGGRIQGESLFLGTTGRVSGATGVHPFFLPKKTIRFFSCFKKMYLGVNCRGRKNTPTRVQLLVPGSGFSLTKILNPHLLSYTANTHSVSSAGTHNCRPVLVLGPLTTILDLGLLFAWL